METNWDLVVNTRFWRIFISLWQSDNYIITEFSLCFCIAKGIKKKSKRFRNNKKNVKDSEKDKFPYKNKEEFIKDTYKIVKSLKKINYDFSNVTIYSFKEDGNNAYEVNIKNLNDIKSENDLDKIIKNVDYSK